MGENEYKYMVEAVKGQLESEKNLIANLSNITAYINEFMDKINWVGFYFLIENELVLGPFQGKAACVRIPINKGVCGKAVECRETILVYDVHEFKGHIACDSASNSEIVIPIKDKNHNIVGVLDVDSPIKGRFTEIEKEALEKVVKEIEKYI